jgi:PAS domain S-box-containing protein
MAPVPPVDFDRSIPVLVRRESEPEPALLPPALSRGFMAVVAAASGVAALMTLLLQPLLPRAGAATLAYTLLALAALACMRLPPRRLTAALLALLVAGSLVMGFAALRIGWGLAAPALPIQALLVCGLAAVAGWRVALAYAAVALGVVVGVAWLGPIPVGEPGAPGLVVMLVTHVVQIVAGLIAGTLLSRVVRQALGAAHKREQRFSRLLALATDLYWEIDKDYRLVAAGQHGRNGQQGVQVRALHPHTGLGALPWELPRFGSDPDTLDLLMADLGSRVPFKDLPFTWFNRDGSPRSYLASGEPRFDARGAFKGYWGVARDVSAVQAARAALAATETRYQEIFARIPTPLVLHRHGRVIEANPAALALFGQPSMDAMRGFELLTAYDSGESRELARRRLEQLMAQAEGASLPPAVFQLRVGSRVLTVQAAGVRVQAQGGPALLSIYMDMTERLAAEDTVRRSEAMLTHLVDTSPDLITLTELTSGTYRMVNKAFERVSGFSAAEVIGRTALELGVWGNEASRDAFVQALTATGSVTDLPVVFRNRSGGAVSMRVSAARFTMDRLDYMVINARDVTAVERQRMERAAILDNASIGIAVTRDRRFVMTNRHFDEMFGWAAGAILGESGAVVWAGADDYAEVGRIVTPSLTRGEAVEFEREARRKNGDGFLARIRARAVNPAQPGDGTVWIIEDVTERRQFEQALARARDDAEAASRAKSAFLANTSHELRTPLNGMIGLARMAAAPGVAEATRTRYLEQITDSAQSLAGIISDILDLSKIEAGRLQIELTRFDLAQLLRALEHTYQTLAEARGLVLRFEIEPGLTEPVRGDPLRVRQIVTNYLSNAIKFTEHGSVRVRVGRLPGGALTGAVRFEVIDTGPGIEAAALPQLFMPFTQADQSTTRRYGGTGLGLSICRELALLMGGDVGVESEPGQGACFWAVLPLPPDHSAPSPEAAPRSAASLEGLRVLMVEDNAVNMMVAVAMLEAWGVTVTQAGDGREALVAVQRAHAAGVPFDGVLMDVQMPVMSGHEATRELRRMPVARGLPIVALTAAALVTERDEALRAGMDDFLTKPIDAEKLKAVLRRFRRG